MASSTVGTAVIKLSFDGKDVKAQLSNTTSEFQKAGTTSGTSFGNALSVAMGSLISKAVSKVASSISSNLSSALNRVDVINNFPRVMSSLGFSTDEASASIQAISGRLDGLPSTLNGVVADVQKLTATMGNLNTGMVNATSLGLALNDMFLAGGKGTEAASLAMEQYNQMLAQGKPDMQSWRSILNAAPGQLNQLAKTLLGAAASQNDLYEALKKGNVTFEQMNEAIVRLDQEGGDGFESFEKQARAATGGIGTALENVQNRIGKAIAKIIDHIGADKIADTINNISASFSGMADVIIGALDWLGQNTWVFDVILSALTALLSMGIITRVVKLFKVITTFVTANPIGIAISLVLTGLMWIITHLEDVKKVVGNVASFFGNVFNTVGKVVGDVARFIGNIFNAIFKEIKAGLQILGNFFGNIFKAIWSVVQPIVTAIGTIFSNVFSAIWNFVSPIITSIMNIFGALFNFVKGILTNIYNFFVSIITPIFNLIKSLVGIVSSVLGTVFNAFKATFTGIWNAVTAAIGPIANFFGNVFGAVWNVVSGAFNAIGNAARGAWDAITGIFSGLADFFGSIFSNAWSAVMAVFSVGGQIFSGIVNGVFETFRAVVNGIIGGINSVIRIPFDAINGVLGGIRGVEIMGWHPFEWVGEIFVPQIPYLAQGGFADGAQMAVIGENGSEVVLPLENNTNNWSGLLANAIMEQMDGSDNNRTINVYMNNTIENDMSIDELGRRFSQSIRRYA